MPEKATSEERDLKALEAALGHHFARPSLLLQALTHSSLRHEKYEKSIRPPKDGSPRPAERGGQSKAAHAAADADLADNERLEFLGDAIVGLLVAESLYRRFPDLSEGELTRLRAALVSRKHLGEVGEKLGLGRWLRMGRNAERSGGRTKGVLLANCVEALAAALYLDAPEPDSQNAGSSAAEASASCGSGGLRAAAAFVESAIIGIAATRLHRELQANEAIGDYKSALQELLQARGERQPDYVLKAATGPDHQKRFVVEVVLGGEAEDTRRALAQGSGSTKKKAEQEAARRALGKLREPSAKTRAGKLGAGVAAKDAKPSRKPAGGSAVEASGAGTSGRVAASMPGDGVAAS